MRRSIDWLAHDPDLNAFLGHVLEEIANQFDVQDAQIFLLRSPRSKTFNPNTEPNLFLPDHLEYHRSQNNQGIVCTLLRQDEQPLGFIGFGCRNREIFSENELELVESLAQQATLAIQLTRLAEEAKQAAIAREQEKADQERVTQLAIANTTLKKTLDVLATEPDLDRTLGHILQVTSEQLRSSSSALWLYKPESDRFWLHLVYLDGEVIAAIPETAHRLTGQWIYKRDLSRDLALKQHIRDRVPVLYDLDDHPDITKWQRQYLKRLGVRSMLGIPLLLGTEIVGSFTIRFADRREFQAEELELVHALANQATLAIQLLRMAYHKQQAAIVEERNRMARDIHDSLAQSLTGVVMQLNAATEFLTSQPHQAQACITRAQNLAKQGLTEARRSVWLLYQSDPTACNLPDSLTQLSEQMTCGKDISIRMSIDGKPYDLDTPVSLNLLRIAQESLTNALRHAKAQTIHLQLAYTPQQIQLRVQDDGCGFDPKQTVGHGFGLTGMGDRAKVIGAQLQIQSKLGVGTEILVTVPISSL